ISSSFANQPTISSSSLFFSDDYQRRKENHFRSLSISILELELAFGVRSFSVSSFKTYPRSSIRSISFLLRFIKTSKHFSFSVIPQIRLSPLHYQVGGLRGKILIVAVFK
ncbi:hypothetical protein LINGRAHAP2_LOCUS24004, partial [Linum grandiflorum]